MTLFVVAYASILTNTITTYMALSSDTNTKLIVFINVWSFSLMVVGLAYTVMVSKALFDLKEYYNYKKKQTDLEVEAYADMMALDSD
jgi:hypothetical protein